MSTPKTELVKVFDALKLGRSFIELVEEDMQRDCSASLAKIDEATTILTALQSSVESESRAALIEECAKIAESFADKNHARSEDRSRFTIYDIQRYTRLAGKLIAEDIRALPASPAQQKDQSQEKGNG
jgi:hypothetical protein